MQSTHKKSKPIFITIIVVVVGLITAGIFYWNTHKKKFIKDKVEQAVVKKTNGLYNIEYGRLDMDEVTGYLAITNVNLSYDSAKYQALLGGEQIPSILFKLHADSIIATGVKTPKK
jgi:flagellar basal body-associated protein FliL